MLPAGLQTGSIVHLPSNRDLITSVASTVRTLSRNSLSELGRSSDPSPLTLAPLVQDPKPPPASDFAGQIGNSSGPSCCSQLALKASSQYGGTLPSAPVDSRAQEVVPGGSKGTETEDVLKGTMFRGCSTALLTCGPTEGATTAPRRENVGLRSHGSRDALQSLFAFPSHEARKGADGGLRSMNGTTSFGMRRSATVPCK